MWKLGLTPKLFMCPAISLTGKILTEVQRCNKRWQNPTFWQNLDWLACLWVWNICIIWLSLCFYPESYVYWLVIRGQSRYSVHSRAQSVKLGQMTKRTRISRLRDFTRYCGKTSVRRLVNRVPMVWGLGKWKHGCGKIGNALASRLKGRHLAEYIFNWFCLWKLFYFDSNVIEHRLLAPMHNMPPWF